MDRGVSAIRSTTRVVEPEPLGEEPISTEQEEKLREDAVLNTYASLADHPGWKQIKKDFEDTIARYRSGQVLKAGIPNMTLEELGRKTITTNAVADELEQIILTVSTAAEQVAEKRAKSGQRQRPD